MNEDVRGSIDQIFNTMTNVGDFGRKVTDAAYEAFGQNKNNNDPYVDSRRNIGYNDQYRSNVAVMNYTYPWADNGPTMMGGSYGSFGVMTQEYQGYAGFYDPMYGKGGYNGI